MNSRALSPGSPSKTIYQSWRAPSTRMMPRRLVNTAPRCEWVGKHWASEMADGYERQAACNRCWRAHYAAMLPPGRERRSRLWLLAYHANRLERRAEFFRAVAARDGDIENALAATE